MTGPVINTQHLLRSFSIIIGFIGLSSHLTNSKNFIYFLFVSDYVICLNGTESYQRFFFNSKQHKEN